MKNKFDPFHNSIILEYQTNKTLDFHKNLSKNNSIIIINCNNLNIYLESTINKIIIRKCSNIKIYSYKLISGLDILWSNQIIINSQFNLNSVSLTRSSVKLYISNTYTPFILTDSYSSYQLIN